MGVWKHKWSSWLCVLSARRETHRELLNDCLATSVNVYEQAVRMEEVLCMFELQDNEHMH